MSSPPSKMSAGGFYVWYWCHDCQLYFQASPALNHGISNPSHRLSKVELYGNDNPPVSLPSAAEIVDLTGAAKTVTGNAVAGGGATAGSIDIGISSGVCVALRVKANGVTVSSDIQFYTAAGGLAANLVYEALAKDCNTSPYHVDGTPWAIPSFGAALVGQLLYYVITNDGALDSTYDIEMVLMGKA